MIESPEKPAHYHVTPVDDWQNHKEGDSSDCDCNPKVELLENGNTLVTHNSYDGREHLENDHDWQNCHICKSDLSPTETTDGAW
jgi:hypothetical protein